MNDNLLLAFTSWADRVMIEHAAAPASAYNFNRYEHTDSFAVQLIGAVKYDPDDPDWSCEESFSSGDNLFEIPRTPDGGDWRQGLAAAKSLISGYLRHGTHADRLGLSSAVCVGFVDGDLEVVHFREDA